MKLLPLAILCGLFFGAPGVLSAIWTIISIVRGEYSTALCVLGVSVFCIGFIIPFVKVVPGNVQPRSDFDETGTVIRPDRGIDVPIQLSLLGLVVASALIVVLEPLGRLDIPVPPAMRFSLPFGCGLIVLMGAPMLWRNLRRGSTKYLRLTPDGFEIAQGWRPQACEWARVEDVTDVTPGRDAPTRGAIVVVTSDDNVATMAAASITPEGRALRELVRFYWQHPERRGELTDGRAIERLK